MEKKESDSDCITEIGKTGKAKVLDIDREGNYRMKRKKTLNKSEDKRLWPSSVLQYLRDSNVDLLVKTKTTLPKDIEQIDAEIESLNY